MTAAIRQFLAQHPDKFDPREYLKPATAAAKAICLQRYEQFGCAGKASMIKPIGLSVMIDRYKNSELTQLVH
jgi:fructose-bisphosphate aldolase class II